MRAAVSDGLAIMAFGSVGLGCVAALWNAELESCGMYNAVISSQCILYLFISQ